MTQAAPSKTMEFDAFQIGKLLPHRYPFLLLDRAMDVVPGLEGSGHKYYSINEWFFPGHFPGEPIVPGVLLVESLAQLTAVVYVAEALAVAGDGGSAGGSLESLADKVGYLVKANVKFMQPVRPGSLLEMKVRITKKMGPLSMVQVSAKVGRTVVVEGELSVSQKP